MWHWIECALHAARFLTYAWFAATALCKLVYLMYPDAIVYWLLPALVRSVVFSPAMVGAVACAYVVTYGWRAYQRWRDAPLQVWIASHYRGDRPTPRPLVVRCAAWLVRLAAFCAVAALFVAGIGRAVVNGSLQAVMVVVRDAIGGALARPNHWGMVVIVVAAAVAVVLGLAVVLAVMSGGGGGLGSPGEGLPGAAPRLAARLPVAVPVGMPAGVSAGPRPSDRAGGRRRCATATAGSSPLSRRATRRCSAPV
ncbi:hypothetical protein [Bifidobacterium phasiani]|uniref:Uncharacterized protein n=1 Tax=Bifidobacterium phasiani TaxID=2834431 RepID=A0ABS6WA15_9BIFI|nr:hypothetical protein [Bifidobacterium phasiani]MBW3083340.1 hypothetical protein [Bifidobacterium phasiani]